MKKHRKTKLVNRTLNQIKYTEFMKKTMPLVRAANPGIQQRDVMKMSAHLYRIEKNKM